MDNELEKRIRERVRGGEGEGISMFGIYDKLGRNGQGAGTTGRGRKSGQGDGILIDGFVVVVVVAIAAVENWRRGGQRAGEGSEGRQTTI